MRGFGISFAEASGAESIGAPSVERGARRRAELSADERELLDLWRGLSPQSRAEVHQLATLKAQLEHPQPSAESAELERLRAQQARLRTLLGGLDYDDTIAERA